METGTGAGKTAALALAVLLTLAVAAAPSPARADSEADAILLAMEEQMRAATNVGVYNMEVIRPDEATRSFRMKSWDDRAGNRSFIHILAPVRDADTTFLKVGGNLWMYLPKLEKDIKIPPAMMLNSWMGSDFSNDDLVRESSVLDDYENTILSREPGPGGIEILTIESIPHPDSPVVWGRLVSRILATGVPVEQRFFDEDGGLVRTMTFERVGQFGTRVVPTRWVMEPADEPGHATVLEIEDMVFDEPIPDQVFTRANLSRRR